jgi:hypothetical protein
MLFGKICLIEHHLPAEKRSDPLSSFTELIQAKAERFGLNLMNDRRIEMCFEQSKLYSQGRSDR